VVHLAAHVLEWPVGGVTWVGRRLLLKYGADRFGKQVLFRPSLNSLAMQGTFQQHYQWCTDFVMLSVLFANCVKPHFENCTKRIKATPE